MCECCGAKKSCFDRGVQNTSSGEANTDGLSEIQQCGNWRCTKTFLTWSHISVSAVFLLLYWFYRTRSTNWGLTQWSENKHWPPPAYNNSYCYIILLFHGRVCTVRYVTCIAALTTTVRLCLEWTNLLSVPGFCAFFCYLPLPVLFGHPLIRFMQLPVKTKPYMGKCPLLSLSDLSLSRNVISSIILDIPATFHTKRSTTVIEHLFFTWASHSWPVAMKYCRLNRSRHTTTNRLFAHKSCESMLNELP